MSFTNESYRELKQEAGECTQGCFDDGISCRTLKLENENYRQEIYTLRRNLEIGENAQRELQETNDFLERSYAEKLATMEKRMQAMSEKYRESAGEYEVRVTELETRLAEAALEKKELLCLLEETKSANLQSTSSSIVCMPDKSNILRSQVEELVNLLKDEVKRREMVEASMIDMEHRCEQLEGLLQITRQHLADRERALEDTREELAVYRAELLSSKATIDVRPPKGNSLFAEVEDRRRIAMDKMSMLHEKYSIVKRECNAKEAEIRALRAERAMMLRRWEDECSNTLADNTELVNRYKGRIVELENRLKIEEKKKIHAEEQPSGDASFSYLHSLLAAKKKEVEELREKMDKRSIEMLLQEEAKSDVEKRLRYWRYKAMSLEAETLTRENQAKPVEVANNGLLETARDGAEAAKIFERSVSNNAVKPIENREHRSEHGAEVDVSTSLRASPGRKVRGLALEASSPFLASDRTLAEIPGALSTEGGDGTGSSCIVETNASMYSSLPDGRAAKSSSINSTIRKTCNPEVLSEESKTIRESSGKSVQFDVDATNNITGKTRLGTQPRQPKYPIVYVSADSIPAKSEP